MSKNYITPQGFKKLQDEYQHLFHVERPKLVETVAWAASNGDRSENADYIYGKRRLREIDRRLGFLASRLEKAEVINPENIQIQKVVFGCRVRLEDEDGQVVQYDIVGEDESEPEKGRISWTSPIAKALLGKTAKSEVIVNRPVGPVNFVILEIARPI